MQVDVSAAASVLFTGLSSADTEKCCFIFLGLSLAWDVRCELYIAVQIVVIGVLWSK